jgi:hypothetical protein
MYCNTVLAILAVLCGANTLSLQADEPEVV